MQSAIPLTRRLAGGALALSLGAVPALSLGDAEASFHRAYYLEHEEGAIEPALELYRSVAADRSAGGELRARAERHAHALAEELAARDFTRLVPEQTILYAELAHPGQDLAMLLSQLGLLGAEGVEPRPGLAVSPALISGLLGLRGAAVAITAIDPTGGPPSGALILHPGELDTVRGTLETVVPAVGAPVEPVRGHATFALPEQGFLTFTSRLIVFGTSRAEVEAVVARLHGEGGPSFSTHPDLAQALATRDGGMLWFCLNAEPVRPMLRAALEDAARRDPQAAMVSSLLDLDSLIGFAGRVGVREDGLALDLSMHLEAGHRNLLFNLLRMPNVDRRTLELVPEGVAFFGVSSLNTASAVADGLRDSKGQPVVTLMDFGRELFGNVTDVALFGLPPDPHGGAGGQLPDIAAVVRVNDPERSRALWGMLLGLGSQAASGGQRAPEHVRIEGLETDVYDLGPAAVYVAVDGNDLILTPSRGALARTAASRRSGRTVLDDSLYAAHLGFADSAATSALVASPGRCARIAAPFMPPRERQQVMPVAAMLEATVLTLGVEQSETHLALRARLTDLPDVSGVAYDALQQWTRGQMEGAIATAQHAAQARIAAAPAPAPRSAPARPLPSEDLAARFERLATTGGDVHAARAAGRTLAQALGDDARALNNLAWALLTEERYGGRFDALALELSERSNELSGRGNWYYLDTLGLACFRAGDVARAVEVQQRAVELAEAQDQEPAPREALARYRAALGGGL